ncbi:MAG: hypothetical protein JXA25_10840 [Anaerolineales bacterium]|nr:hypothetical protein [Anaerolineales bacterium]
MTVSSLSNVSMLASYASQMQSNRTQAKVAEKVLDQVQDQAAMQADALVSMIEESTRMLEATGQIFDISI